MGPMSPFGPEAPGIPGMPWGPETKKVVYKETHLELCNKKLHFFTIGDSSSLYPHHQSQRL